MRIFAILLLLQYCNKQKDANNEKLLLLSQVFNENSANCEWIATIRNKDGTIISDGRAKAEIMNSPVVEPRESIILYSKLDTSGQVKLRLTSGNWKINITSGEINSVGSVNFTILQEGNTIQLKNRISSSTLYTRYYLKALTTNINVTSDSTGTSTSEDGGNPIETQ